MAFVPPDVRLIVGGTGTQRDAFERLSESLGLSDRVTFLGEVDDATLIDLYAQALAVIYPPFDEDFGYVTLEAFLSHKPVITTTDAGEPTAFVVDGENGCVTAPDPAALADAIAGLARDRARAGRLGEAGFERARQITWSDTIARLVADLPDGRS
jgi:glycosyltransferase involved in cell wall biosynthesis